LGKALLDQQGDGVQDHRERVAGCFVERTSVPGREHVHGVGAERDGV
jgi:hypothetical protein